MQNAHLDGLVDFAEGRVHRALNRRLGSITGLLAVSVTGEEATLHQGAKGGFVGAIAHSIAFGNLNPLFRCFVIGH